jgi:hypothetical protein
MKPKPARFINHVHFSFLALELGRPVQQGIFAKTRRRLGITSTYLLHHHIKILVHINPKSANGRTRPVASLMIAFAPIKLGAGFLE